MLFVIGFALISLLIVIVWCWYLKHEIEQDYDPLRKPYITADKDDCITSVSWRSVLKKFVAYTSFEKFLRLLVIIIVVFGLLFFLGLMLLYCIMRRIGRLKRLPERRFTEPEPLPVEREVVYHSPPREEVVYHEPRE
jgi:hypothetical protein